MIDWKKTLIKSAIVGVFAAAGIWLVALKGLNVYWAAGVVFALKTVMDVLKRKFMTPTGAPVK